MNINTISLSALNAYEKKLNVSANNVANVNTEKFKPSEGIMNDNSDSGVYVTVGQSASPGVDLAKEMADVMITQNGFKANLKTLQTSEELTKSVIDIKA